MTSWGTRFHSSVGTGFRAPSLFEMYDPTYGNADLVPEESRGFDFGIEQAFWDDRAVVDVTYFQNSTKNVTQWAASGYQNINRAKSRGFESGLNVDVLDNLSLNGTYTFTLSEDKSTGRTLSRRPKHEGTFTVAWEPMEDLTTDVSMRAKGRTVDGSNPDMGAFAVFDVKSGYKINENATLYGRIENIFDKQYQEVSKYGTPGRAAYIGVRASF